MRFAVVESGRDRIGSPSAGADRIEAIGVEDVHAEARRRLREARIDEWRTREFITGRRMPHDVAHFAMQVEFAAQAIARLSPIPPDFDDDVYWPRHWG